MALAGGVSVESSVHELLDSQTLVWNHIFSYINSMSLKCAIQLGILDVIHKHGKPITLSQLVDALPINKEKSDGLRRLMRILVHSKFFDLVNNEDEDKDVDKEEEYYCLTGASRLLLRGEPLSMVPLALIIFDPVMMDPWHHMSEWFRDECSSSFETKHGMTFWDYAAGDGRLNALFNEGMTSDAGFVSGVLCKDYMHVFEGLKSMVDVGGGIGATARSFVAAFPGLRCVVLAPPHVVYGLKGSGNLSFVGGDMFESIPHADAVFSQGKTF